jgi:hypothetical protein
MKDAKDVAKDIALSGYSRGVFHSKSFDRDFAVFMTTRKMIDRFLRIGQINEKLLINNIVVTLNVFGTKKVSAIFRVLLDDVQFSVAKAVLMFLHQYDWSVGAEVWPNRIVVDVLKDVSMRYNLSHL